MAFVDDKTTNCIRVHVGSALGFEVVVEIAIASKLRTMFYASVNAFVNGALNAIVMAAI